MDLITKLENAAKTFQDAHDAQSDVLRDRSVSRPPTPEVLEKMQDLGIALTILEAFNEDQLREMIEARVVHSSMLGGGSLSIATGIQDSYRKGEYSLSNPYGISADNLEQLARVCNSAKNILEKRLADVRLA